MPVKSNGLTLKLKDYFSDSFQRKSAARECVVRVQSRGVTTKSIVYLFSPRPHKLFLGKENISWVLFL